MGESVADRLRRLRRERGDPTQKDVAIAVGCAYRSYQNWEAGSSTPSHAFRVPLGKYYGVSPTYILEGDPPAPSASGGADESELAAISAKLDRIIIALESLAPIELSGTLADVVEDLNSLPPIAPLWQRAAAARDRPGPIQRRAS